MRSENYHQGAATMEGVKFASDMAANTNRRALRPGHQEHNWSPSPALGCEQEGLARKTCCCGSQEPTWLCWTPPCYQEICCNAGKPTYKCPTGQMTGFVFQNCTVDGNKEFMVLFQAKSESYQLYLGRPWEEYAKTIYVSCYLGKVVRPEGWLPWRGDFALRMMYYGEFDSRGAWCKSHSED